MDNASKALIIAGGVLIAIAIISVTLYMFAQARDLADASNQILEQSQIEAFNRFYHAYAPSFNKDYNITGLDAYNVYNKVVNNNLGKESGDYQYISFTFGEGVSKDVLEDSVNYTQPFKIVIYKDSIGLINKITIKK